MTSFTFPATDRFTDRNWYYIQLIVEAEYESGGTRYTINNVAYKDSQPQNDNPFSSGSPRSYSVPNGRAGSMTGPYFENGSDSGWSFQFNAGTVPQTQNIWGNGFFTRWIQESDNPSTVTISAEHSLLGDASATAPIKHVFRTSFDYNGGSGSTSFEDQVDGNSISLPPATRSGYNFLGWSSGGINYGTGNYTVNATRTLVAQWETAISPVNITNGISNRTLRAGDSLTFGDFISATDLRSDHSSPGVDWALSGTNSSYFSINSSGSNDYVGWNIPTSASPQTFTLFLTAYGPSTTDSDSASITISPPLPSWTDDNLPDGRKGENYLDATISASNTSYWIIDETPSLAGVSATDTSGTTAQLTGTPSDYGNFTITATPYNSAGEAGPTRNISITIKDVFPQWSDQIILNNVATQGDTNYTEQVSVISGPDITYSVSSGSLPDGLELNPSTGVLSANSTTGITAVPDTYTFRITATNGSNESIETGDLNIVVEAAGGYVKVRQAGQWVDGTVYVRQGGQWVETTVKLRNGGTWTDSFSS